MTVLNSLLSKNNSLQAKNNSLRFIKKFPAGREIPRRKPMTLYAETHRRSLAEPEEFWAEAAEAIDWERRWDRVLDDSRPPFYRWFAGGRLNTCWNALDRHVRDGRGEQPALIYDSP